MKNTSSNSEEQTNTISHHKNMAESSSITETSANIDTIQTTLETLNKKMSKMASVLQSMCEQLCSRASPTGRKRQCSFSPPALKLEYVSIWSSRSNINDTQLLFGDDPAKRMRDTNESCKIGNALSKKENRKTGRRQ